MISSVLSTGMESAQAFEGGRSDDPFHMEIALADPEGLAGASFPQVMGTEDRQFFPESEVTEVLL